MELLLRRKCHAPSSSSSSSYSSSVDRGSGRKWIGSYSSCSPVSGYVGRTESGLTRAGVQTRIRRRRQRRRRAKTATKEQTKIARRRSNSDMNSDDVSDERTGNKNTLVEEEEAELEEEEEEEEEDEKEEVEMKEECEGVVSLNQREQNQEKCLDQDSFGLDRFCGKLRLYADSVIEAQSKLNDLLQDLSSSNVRVVDCSRSRSSEGEDKQPPRRSQISRAAATAAAGGGDSFESDFDGSWPEKCYSVSDGEGLDCNDDTSRLEEDEDDDEDLKDNLDNLDIVRRIQADADPMNFRHQSQNERMTEKRTSGESSSASLPPLLMATPGQQCRSPTDPSTRGDDPRRWVYEGVFVAPLLAEQMLSRTKPKNPELMTSAQPENNNNNNNSVWSSKVIGEDFTLKKRIKFDEFSAGGSPPLPPPSDLSVLKTSLMPQRSEDGARTESALRRTFEVGFEPDKAGNYDPEAVRERYLSAESSLARLTNILSDRRKSKSYIDAKIESLKRELSRLESTFLSEKARLVKAKKFSEYQLQNAAVADAMAFDYRSPAQTRSGVAYEPLDPPKTTSQVNDGEVVADESRDGMERKRPVQTLAVESSSISYGDRPRETALALVTTRPVPTVSQVVVARETGENPGLDDPPRNRNQITRISDAPTDDPRKNTSGQMPENRPLCLTSRPVNEPTMSEKTPLSCADSGSRTDVSRQADDVIAAKSSPSDLSPSDLSPPNCSSLFVGSNSARLSTEKQANRLSNQRKRTRDNCDAKGAIEARKQSTAKTDTAPAARIPEISGKSPLLPHHPTGPGDAAFRREAPRATYGPGLLVGEGLRTVAFIAPAAAGPNGAPPSASNTLHMTSSISPSFAAKYGVSSERKENPDPSDAAHVAVARATVGNLYSAHHPPNGYHHHHHHHHQQQQQRIVSYGQNTVVSSREPDVVYGVGAYDSGRRWVSADPRPREAVALQSPLYHHPHLALPAAGGRNPLPTEHPGIRHFQDLRQRTLLLDGGGGGGPMAVGNVPLQYPSKDHLDLILTYQAPRRGLLPSFGSCADFRDPGYQGYLSSRAALINGIPPGNASRLMGYRPSLSESIVFPQRDGTLW